MKKIIKKIFKREKSFSLVEIIIVVSIIGILASYILPNLNLARKKGADGAIKASLKNATEQASIFYGGNADNPSTFIGVCTNGDVGGTRAIGDMVNSAAKGAGMDMVSDPNYYDINNSLGSATGATCNEGDGSAWAAEVPLKSTVGFWCVDSIGDSYTTTTSIGSGTACPVPANTGGGVASPPPLTGRTPPPSPFGP